MLWKLLSFPHGPYLYHSFFLDLIWDNKTCHMLHVSWIFLLMKINWYLHLSASTFIFTHTHSHTLLQLHTQVHILTHTQKNTHSLTQHPLYIRFKLFLTHQYTLSHSLFNLILSPSRYISNTRTRTFTSSFMLILSLFLPISVTLFHSLFWNTKARITYENRHTHTHSWTHTHSPTLSLSLSHTHTHTHTHLNPFFPWYLHPLPFFLHYAFGLSFFLSLSSICLPHSSLSFFLSHSFLPVFSIARVIAKNKVFFQKTIRAWPFQVRCAR